MAEKKEGYYGCVFSSNFEEDFYNIDDRFTVDIGYGEEPSYIFYLKKDGAVQKGIDIWEAYIEAIAELIPMELGRMTGLPYYLNVGIFEDEHWHIDDTEHFYRQLKAVDPAALNEMSCGNADAHSALLAFVKEMLDSGNEIDVMRF